MKIRSLILVLALGLMLTPAAFAQRKPKESKNKFGAIHYRHSNSTYTLTGKSSGDAGTTESTDGSETIVGTMFFYDRVFKSKFAAGLIYSPFLERRMEISSGTNDWDIVEKTSFIAFNFKAYFKDHTIGGIKPYINVGLGQYTVESEITRTDSTGSTEESETSATIPVTILGVGFDYFWEFGGFRANAGMITGERTDLDSNDDYEATYDMNGVTASIAVYSLF